MIKQPKEDNHDELETVIDRIKSKGNANISNYEKALIEWHKNVDKGYAWVVLIALWFVLAALLGSYRIHSLIFAKVTSEGIYNREEASWPVLTIYTVENLIGPLISVVSFNLKNQSTMMIGGVLMTLANCFAALSTNLYIDTILLGIVQGIGYAFVFIPFLEIVNNYFIKYRNSALGFALCGGSISVFGLKPIFEFILDSYHWRFSYYGMAIVSCIIVFMAPLFKSNQMPTPEMFEAVNLKIDSMIHNHQNEEESVRVRGEEEEEVIRKLSILSTRALTYQKSLHRPSTILISRKPSANERGEAQLSLRSVSSFSNAIDLERNILLSIENYQRQQQHLDTFGQSNLKIERETISMNEIKSKNSNFNVSNVWVVLRSPAFHVLWYCELIFFCMFTINCLILIDSAIDHGLTKDESKAMLNYQSIGEIFGRVVLTIFVDMRFLSNKNVVVLTLILLAGFLTTTTYITSFICLAALTVAIASLLSLLEIMLNGLLIDYLGEQQVTLGYGMASCIVGVLITVRSYAVGFSRDYLGSYNLLTRSLALSCLFGALLWIIEPKINTTIQGLLFVYQGVLRICQSIDLHALPKTPRRV